MRLSATVKEAVADEEVKNSEEDTKSASWRSPTSNTPRRQS
jgi:hypothetical protein